MWGYKSRFWRLLFGIALAQVGFSTGESWIAESPVVGGSTIAIASPRYQRQPEQPALPDFEDDEEFEDAGEGFHAIYVDHTGNVLGTFVNVPGAKIKVYSTGAIAIAEQDYTHEIEYFSNGRIRAIGDAEFGYFSNGRIREIDDIEFGYLSSGRLRTIDDVDFTYFSDGRVQAISNVRFEYDFDRQLSTLSDRQTRDGIRIVVVD